MNIGIAGLGLIGGSLAKSISELGVHKVYGIDTDLAVMEKAKKDKAILGELNDTIISQCDLVILALTPQIAINFVQKKQKYFRGTVMDICGVKEAITKVLLPLSRQNDFVYLGGHPMAGKETSGYLASDSDLFFGASMLLVCHDEPGNLPDIEQLCRDIGFGEICYTTDKEHDQIIALTSQLAHVVSGAYVKSPSAIKQRGFSAGSFQDLTRVATLDVDMWTELMLLNRHPLAKEIEGIVQRLNMYKEALINNDQNMLSQCLREGVKAKEKAMRDKQ